MQSGTSRRRFLERALGAGVGLAMSATLIYRFIQLNREDSNRTLPPGQHESENLIVLHEGPIPPFDEKNWAFEVYGLVKRPFTLSYDEFRRLPSVVAVSDFHCVTGWSKLDNKWEGVQSKTVLEKAGVLDNGKFATIECEYGYATSLSLEDLLRDDVLLAYRLEDGELPREHGGPLRIVVPHKYGYKSAKWVRKIKVTEVQEIGYWESLGYSNNADPFIEDRYF